MSEKRRDNRGRILRNGESQRQDGRYAYKYKDLNGDTKFVYSWRLEKTTAHRPERQENLRCGKRRRKSSRIYSTKLFPTAAT